MRPIRWLPVWVTLAAQITAAPAGAQDLGHRIMGTLGLDAGSQPPTGVYVVSRVGYYRARRLRDRVGAIAPVEGFELDALSAGVGIAATLEIPEIGTYVSAAAAFPFAAVWVSAERPQASLDTWGLGDVYVEPLRLGWRLDQLDLIVLYGLYIPTDVYELGSGSVSRGHFVHQLSAGGTVYFDDERAWRFSVVASYDLNETKQGVDITRGDAVHVQGGVGGTFLGVVDLGIVGYALWQVRDDRGSELPPVLAGARDQTFGLGAEVGVRIPSVRLRLGLRWARDVGLGVESRPEGQIVLLSVTWAAWNPAPPRADPRGDGARSPSQRSLPPPQANES